MSTQAKETGMIETFEEEMGMRDKEASALAEEFESIDALIEYIVADKTLTDISGVGRTTASRVNSWFQENFPDRERERKEQSEAYCTKFVGEEAYDEPIESDDFHFAFICPRCSATNPLVGDPDGFANRPFDCQNCHWVSLLDAESIEEFAEENCPE